MQVELPHICGHIHPVVRMKGKGRQKIRLRCFIKEPTRLILPAFGYFTGGFEIKPQEEIIIYPIAGERLYSLLKQ
jgi:metallophosphoesterase superfamily enzyme